MTDKKIDNVRIFEDSNKVIIDYYKTSKDWVDSIVTTFIGLLFSVLTVVFTKYGFKPAPYIAIIVGLMLAFVAATQTILGLERLLHPTRNKLRISKANNTLTIKKNVFSSKTLAINDLAILVIEGQKEKLYNGGVSRTRVSCLIKVKLVNDSEETLLVINTDRFLSKPDRQLETELYLKSKRLATELNNHLQLKYKWTGFHEV